MEYPGVSEIADFKFLQMRKFFIEGPPTYAINLLAASSRFGLIFVGHSKGFRILQLSTILELDNDATKRAKEICSEYAFMEVASLFPITNLSLSCDDLILAVCSLNKDSIPVTMFYDVRSFSSQGSINGWFNEIRLSSTPGTNIAEFSWNPSVVEMFAVCLTDGSITVYEIGDDFVKITGSLPATEAVISLCWSPKGKQLVAGKKDGSLAQYKPTLQLSKLIAVPSAIKNPVSVKSVCWLSTTLFAALYIPQDPEDASLSLVLISVPKGVNPVFTNFGDVCYGSGERSPKYLMSHLPEWKVLLCSSANSLETTVIGMDENQGWQQWILEDTARAELPLSKSEDTFPMGMAIVTCSQKQVMVSDTQTFPPMPILLLLSTAGILCPFHMVNMRSQAANLISAPMALTSMGQPRAGKGLYRLPEQEKPSPFQTSTPLTPMSHQEFGNKIAATNVKANLLPRFSEEPAQAPPQPLSLGVGQTFGFSPVPNPPHPIAPVQMSSEPSRQESNPPLVSPRPTLMGEPVHRKTSRPMLTPVAPSKTNVLRPTEQDKNAIDSTYKAAVLDEIKDFDEEVLQLKSLLQSSSYSVGTKEEMGKIRNRTQEMLEFCEGMKKTVQSLNLDIHTLKGCLLDTFSMLEDARSLDVRNKDPVYLALLRGRPLDPVSTRKLKGIRKLMQYLQSQIQEIQGRLDQDWEDYVEKKRKFKSFSRTVSGTDVIYRTLSNNLNAIQNMEESLDILTTLMKDKKLTLARSNYQPHQDLSHKQDTQDLSSLADSLLQTKLSETETSSPRFINNLPKRLDTKKESYLRDFLSNRKVNVVKAKQISSLSESHFISPIKLLKDSAAIQEQARKSAEPSAKAQSSLVKEVTVLTTESTVFQPLVSSKPDATFQPVATQPATAPKGSQPVTSVPKTTVPHTVGGIIQGLPLMTIKPTTLSSTEVLLKVAPKTTSPTLAFTNNTQSPPNVTLPFNAPLILPTVVKPAVTNTVFVPTSAKGPSAAATSPLFSGPFIQTKPLSSNLSEINTSMVTTLTTTAGSLFSGAFMQTKPLEGSLSTSTTSNLIGTSSASSFSFSKPANSQLSFPPSLTSTQPLFPFKSDFTFKIPQSPQVSSPSVTSSQKPEQVADKLGNVKESETQYEDVTPPETPQPKENSQTKDAVGEETKIIEVSLNHGKEPGPSVKVCSPADFSFKIPTNPSFSLSHLTLSSGTTAGVGTGLSAFTKQPISGGKSTFQFTLPGNNQPTNKPDQNSTSNLMNKPTSEPFKSQENLIKVDTLVSSISEVELEPKETSTESPTALEIGDSKEKPPESENLETSKTEEVAKPISPVTTITTSPKTAVPFGQTTVSPFGTAPTVSPFGTVPVVSPFCRSPTATTNTTTSLFGKRSSTNAVQSTVIEASPTTASSSIATTTVTTTQNTLFSNNTSNNANAPFAPSSPPSFGKTSPGVVFGSGTSVFSQAATKPLFSVPATNATLTSSGSLFGSPPVTSVTTLTSSGSVFGSPPVTSVATSTVGFGSQPTTTSGTVFGKLPETSNFGAAPPPAFGQPASPGFGGFGQPAFGQSSLFGQQKQPFGQPVASPPVFTQPASPNSGLFGKSPNNSGLFGSQQSGFFGGLGNKVSTGEPNKNVFGAPSGLFGAQGATTFGTPFAGQFRGSFSSGGTSVAQSGFGAFQQAMPPQQTQQQTPTKTGGFGSPPSFGTPPVFGSSPSFGSAAGFGQNQPTFGSAFGSITNSSPSAFAGTTTNPRFEALGSQAPSFGSLSPQGNAGFNSTSPTFGSLSSFGGQQQSQPQGFGSQSSAFSQWRQ